MAEESEVFGHGGVWTESRRRKVGRRLWTAAAMLGVSVLTGLVSSFALLDDGPMGVYLTAGIVSAVTLAAAMFAGMLAADLAGGTSEP